MISTRKIWLAVVFLLALVAGHDFAVPVRKAYGARAAIAAIDQYRVWISPRLKGHVFCRFTPTCSLYGRESIRKYGLLKGGARAAWRVARCNPWTPAGTFDPP